MVLVTARAEKEGTGDEDSSSSARTTRFREAERGKGRDVKETGKSVRTLKQREDSMLSK